MLAVIVVAALTPNIGIVAAQAKPVQLYHGPQYSLEYALIGVLVAAIVAAIVALLIFQRRKNRGKGGAGGVAAWRSTAGRCPAVLGPSMDDTGGGGMVAREVAVGAGRSGGRRRDL